MSGVTGGSRRRSLFSTRLRELRVQRGLRQKDLAAALGLGQTTIANYERDLRFPDERTLLKAADFFQTSLDYLLGRIETPPGGPAPREAGESSRPLAGLGRRYLDTLRGGRREAAFALVARALSRGATVKEVYLDALGPALWEVGRLWSTGEMQVAEEHWVAEATQALISRLYPFVRRASRRSRARRCLVFSVCGEQHTIGARMVTDFFEMDGWDALFLGGNLCEQHALAAIAARTPDVVALSVTMPYHVVPARELISAVRGSPALAAVKVLVGGQALNEDPLLWTKIGADALARDPDEAVKAANRLVGRKR